MGLPADRAIQIRSAILGDMNKRWQPHKGQAMSRYIAHHMNPAIVFIQCGRKWGKTDWLLREAVEAAVLPQNDAEVILYVGPEDTHVKRFAWLERRAQKMCHPSLIRKEYEGDMRIEYTNGRHLILCGANNVKLAEGNRPGKVLIDEAKWIGPAFYNAMEPNLSVYGAQVFIAGTPPDAPCWYTEMADFTKQLQEESGEGHWTRQPSWMNDKVPGLLNWLYKRRAWLKAKGEEHVWLREYEGLYVPGGAHQIFPMYAPDAVSQDENTMTAQLSRGSRNYHWYCIADPAVDTTFAVLFVALNPDTKDIYIVDGIYEKDRNQTSCRAMWPRIEMICRKWLDDLSEWFFYYDDHEAWFAAEMQATAHGIAWCPSGKQTRDKMTGISLIKDILLSKKLRVNAKLREFHDEFIAARTDPKTNKPVKLKDHYIDCFRYFLYASHYELNEREIEFDPDEWKQDPYLEYAESGDEGEAIIDDPHIEEDWLHDMFNDWATYA